MHVNWSPVAQFGSLCEKLLHGSERNPFLTYHCSLCLLPQITPLAEFKSVFDLMNTFKTMMGKDTWCNFRRERKLHLLPRCISVLNCLFLKQCYRKKKTWLLSYRYTSFNPKHAHCPWDNTLACIQQIKTGGQVCPPLLIFSLMSLTAESCPSLWCWDLHYCWWVGSGGGW